MNDNKTVRAENYSHILQQINTILNLSLKEIRKIYFHYPICIMNYFENDKKGKAIEIRFDQEEITMTCTFDSDGRCNCISLFPDTDEIIEKFIDFLEETYNYDFIKTQWTASNLFIRIKKVNQSINDICFSFQNSSALK